MVLIQNFIFQLIIIGFSHKKALNGNIARFSQTICLPLCVLLVLRDKKRYAKIYNYYTGYKKFFRHGND